MIRRPIAVAMTAAALTVSLSACGGSTDKSAAAPVKSSGAPHDAPAGKDRTAAFRSANKGKPWLGDIGTITQTEPGRLTVETSIVDPRGADGSPAAKEAIKVCRAAVAMLKSNGTSTPHVSVMESDGSTFVIYGHPAYGEKCAEV